MHTHPLTLTSFCISLEIPVLQVMLTWYLQELPDIPTMESYLYFLSPVRVIPQRIQPFIHNFKQSEKQMFLFAFIH